MAPSRVGVFAVFCVLCVEVASCAGPRASLAGGRGVDPSTAFTPAAPAAEVYSTRAEAAVSGDAFALQIAAQVDGLRTRSGLPALTRDGRLDRVALDVLRATGPCRAPSADLLAFLLWRQGIVEPEPNLFLHCGDEGAEPIAQATMRAQFASAAGKAEWRRVGIGVERSPGVKDPAKIRA